MVRPLKELAAKSARLALELRKRLPEAPIAIAAERSRDGDINEVIDRGAQSIVREAFDRALAGAVKHPGAGAIRVDDRAVKVLEDEFRIERSALGYFLTGKGD